MRLHFINVAVIAFAIFTAKNCYSQENKNIVKNGRADLTKIDLTQTEPIPLSGDWEFYWNELLTPADSINFYSESKEYYQVPDTWSSEKNSRLEKYGYATYRLVVDLGKPVDDIAIKLGTFSLNNKVYVNGKFLGQAGQVGTNVEEDLPDIKVQVLSFDAPDETVEIIIQVSNFHSKWGGLGREILIGDGEVLRSSRRNLEWLDLFLFGSIFMMGLYHVGLFFARTKSYSPLIFSLFCFMIALRIITNENFGTDIISLDPFIHRKIDYLTFYIGFGLFFYYSTLLFKKDTHALIVKIALGVMAIFSLSVVILPVKIYSEGLEVFQLLTFVCMIYLTYIMIVATIRKRFGAKIYLIGWGLLFTTGINDLLHFSGLIETTSIAHIGILLFIITQAYLLMVRYERTIKRNSYLAKKLNYTNKTLEKRVATRTRDLAQKNKSITESIIYAEKIQKALLPLETDVKKFFPESFIFIKPTNLVGGDFSWFKHIENTDRGTISVIIGADCTVQGVSGALMTVSGNAFLDQIITQQKEYEPDQIAAKLNNAIRNLLHQTQSKDSVLEGINAAICIVYHDEQSLEYVGANMPLIYTEKKVLKYIKPTSISLGGNLMQVDNSIFEKHKIWLREKDVSFYMYSNGYTNQRGGSSKEAFGTERLKDLIANLKNNSISDQSLEFEMAIENWMIEGGLKQQDDMMIMGFDLSNFKN